MTQQHEPAVVKIDHFSLFSNVGSQRVVRTVFIIARHCPDSHGLHLAFGEYCRKLPRTLGEHSQEDADPDRGYFKIEPLQKTRPSVHL
jgi:hypothetical protein